MRIILLILLSMLSFVPAAKAGDITRDYKSFASIPVLAEGRIIPLDIFAAAQLGHISGRSHIGTDEAIETLAEIIFNPASAAQIKLINLRNEVLRERFNIQTKRGDLLSLDDLQSVIEETRGDLGALLERDPASLSKDERDLLSLHNNVRGLVALMRSLSLILPLNVDVPLKYETQKGDVAYLDLARYEPQIMAELKSIVRRKGHDVQRYSAPEQKTALLAYDLQSIRAGGEKNTALKIMPLSWDESAQEFRSPWQMILSGQGSPDSAAYLSQWRAMATAYRSGDAGAWYNQSADVLSAAKAQLGTSYPSLHFTLERLYHNLQPFSLAAFLYGAALLCLLIYALRGASWSASAARISLFGGVALHSIGMALRVLILERPPVGTLYESVLFVALICAVLGLILTRRKAGIFYLTCGSIAALLLLLIAPFIAGETQTLGVLSAVLNTNFWLATHVLCITIGYGVCVMAALCAHGALLARSSASSRLNADHLTQITYRFSLAALLFTAVGTILGGIWADQSWGRFWGWDPKENGALLIVLWLIWLQHGRLSGHINALHFAAGVAMLNLIVALAWFGVNLLSVGLHSYGFTSGLAMGLATFCTAQTLIIIALWWRAYQQEKSL